MFFTWDMWLRRFPSLWSTGTKAPLTSQGWEGAWGPRGSSPSKVRPRAGAPGQRSCPICTLPRGQGLPGGSEGKASACNGGDPDSIPGSGRSPGEVNGNPLQYSCQEIPMDGGAWEATVHRVARSRTQLSNLTSLRGQHLLSTYYTHTH